MEIGYCLDCNELNYAMTNGNGNFERANMSNNHEGHRQYIILRDQNTGFLQTIKEIEKLYEQAAEHQGLYAEYSKEWKEFERYTDALPPEAWIQ